jgi:O-acetyl-ADP-ribose deacetylase (regulator of RNase III)
MLKVVTGNLLNETKGILVHGVNCQGKMGAGIALQIKQHYPYAFNSYLAFCRGRGYEAQHMLGCVDFVQMSDQLIIANAFIQDTYGPGGRRYVSYDAIDRCFAEVRQQAIRTGLPVKYPRIGAGLAGGNWDVISTIINANLPLEIDQALFVM